MDENELKTIIANEIANSLGIDGSRLADERLRLQEYYEGLLPLGNGIADRSQIKDRSVLEVVHWLLPELIRVFMSSDKVISFEPRRPQDVAMAQAATEYVNFILREDNEGFRLIYEWIKTSLVAKNGFLKVSFEDQPQVSMNSFSGLNDQELDMLMQELDREADRYEILDQSDYPDPMAPPPPSPGMAPPGMAPPGMAPPGMAPGPPGAPPGMFPPSAGSPPPPPPQLHDLRIRITTREGRVVIRHVLPEEILISRRMPGMVFNGDHFIGHRVRKNVTDLRLLGYSEDLIDEARGDDSPDWNIERIARFEKDEDYLYPTRTDEAMVNTWISECYLKVDWDGDGIAELRKVVTARDGQIIFENEEIDEVPIINLTPIIEPGRAIGMSIAELVADLQECKTAIMRGVMDSLYLSLVPRVILNMNKLTEDTIDDLEIGSPGSGIRVNDDGAIEPIVVPFIGQQALGVIEQINQQIQTRTGVGPQNNIISPDVLNNQTAAGISMQQSAASGQIELICRVMAETGFRELARHILGLVVRHQDKARMIRLNGQFVEMNPKYWHENFDISVTVGLGTGNKEKTTRDLTAILQIMQPILAAQKGMTGPFITAQDVHSVTTKLTEAMGYKEDFFPHLMQPQQPPPGQPGGQPPDPEMMKVQVEAQALQQRTQAQIEAQKAKDGFQMQQDTLRFQHQAQLDQQKAQHQIEIERQRETFRMQMEQQRQQAEMTRADNKARSEAVQGFSQGAL